MNEKTKKLCIEMAFIIGVPIIIMIIMSLIYNANGFYPFGNGTIAWCDMTQQVVPLTADLDDMLSGKTGFFLNMQNAGGMNMIGVMFFFVASPLNLLTLVIPKQDLVLFMNVLTMIKLMAAGLTAMLFFRRCMKKLSPVFAACLSLSYAFCGYAVVYYQNSIWLDVMYLFPLLMMGIYSLVKNGKVAPYVATLSLMAVVNYYICYMIALFCILFFALLCINDKQKKYAKTGFLFLTGSLSAALITAVVWLPSLLQYFSSGRTTSVTQNLVNTTFLSEFQSVLPLLLYSGVGIVICLFCVIDKRKRTAQNSMMLTMLTLMLVAMIAEPINLMWHTGSYMSFPCRFAFITIFLMMICSAQFLEQDSVHISEPVRRGKLVRYAVPICCCLVFVAAAVLSNMIRDKNSVAIGKYSRALWSDDAFLAIEVKLFFVFVVTFAVVFLCYKKGLLVKKVFMVLLSGFVLVQSVNALGVYMVGAKDYSVEKAIQTRKAFSLEGKINDDSFYRVKTTNKIFDVNNIGAMGYRSLSHYTSLTDRAYMYAMKKLGYSSYWMEVGSHGGTELTDALFSVKYKITGTPLEQEHALFSNEDYSIYERKNVIGLGLITDRDISKMDSFDELNRFEVQQQLYKTLFAKGSSDELMTAYEPTSTGEVIVNEEDGDTLITVLGNNNSIIYDFFVSGRQMLYFDCFDKLSSNLNEPINSSFKISVNNFTIQSEYPSQGSNGLLRLGEFENCKVRVEVNALQNVQCSSFGVYGLDMDKLDSAVKNAKSAQLDEERGVITGECEAQEGEKCVLFVPYAKTFNVQINGERVDYEKAFDDFIVFDLKQGTNDIRITSEPMGLTAGLILSAAGVLFTALIYLLRRKVKLDDAVYSVCRITVIVIGALTFIAVYVLPVIINCTGPKGKLTE